MQGFAGKFSTLGHGIFELAPLHPKILEKFQSKRALALQAPACRTFAKEKSMREPWRVIVKKLI